MRRATAISAAAVALILAASTTSVLGGGRNSDTLVHLDAPSPPTPLESTARIALTPEQTKQAIATGALDREIKSILKVDHAMRHGEFLWNEANVPDGPVWIRVDLQRQLISIFRSGHEIGTAVILYGAHEKATPPGDFRVLWKREDHHSATYDAPMPYTLRLTEDGIAIHGSEVLSGRATHGCIGVPLEFARHLFERTAIGAEVVIVA